MSRGEMPEAWASALAVKGIDSIRGLAARGHVSVMAASRLVKGQGTSTETVNSVAADVFDGDRELVWRLHGLALKDYGDWDLPAEASLLDQDQRDALLASMRAMLPAEIRRASSKAAGRRKGLKALPPPDDLHMDEAAYGPEDGKPEK